MNISDTMTPSQPDDLYAINAQLQKLIADQQATITTITEQYENLKQQLVELRYSPDQAHGHVIPYF